jgi:dTDP-4-amino-4,6-dideoxygalactose transaminase
VLHALRDRGIGASVHYPTPVHLQPAWSGHRYGPGDLPATEALTRRTLSLPLFPGITEGEIERVAAAVRASL